MNQQCPLCSSSNTEHFYQDTQQQVADYWQCANCSLVFQQLDQRMSVVDELNRYKTHNNDPEDERYVNYLRPIWDFAFVAKKHASILDFGCGEGKPLLNFNSEVQNYDPLFYPDTKLLNAQYDLIFCIETVEHFYAPRKEFTLLRSLLKPGGHLLVRTGILHNRQDFADWWYHKDPTHVCFYQPQTFIYIADEFNLHEVKTGKDLVLLEAR